VNTSVTRVDWEGDCKANDVPRVNVPDQSARVKVPFSAPATSVPRDNVPVNAPIAAGDEYLGNSTVPKPRVDGDGDKDDAGDKASPAMADHGFTGPG